MMLNNKVRIILGVAVLSIAFVPMFSNAKTIVTSGRVVNIPSGSSFGGGADDGPLFTSGSGTNADFQVGGATNYQIIYDVKARANNDQQLFESDLVPVGSQVTFYYSKSGSQINYRRWMNVRSQPIVLGVTNMASGFVGGFGSWIDSLWAYPSGRPPYKSCPGAVSVGWAGFCAAGAPCNAASLAGFAAEAFSNLCVLDSEVTFDVTTSTAAGILKNCSLSASRLSMTCTVNKPGGIEVGIRFKDTSARHDFILDPAGPVDPYNFKGAFMGTGIVSTYNFARVFFPGVKTSFGLTAWMPKCSDGTDNDGDGKTDFPADLGCTDANDNDETDPPLPLPQCSDLVDNDTDGKIDTADPGCHTDGNAGNAASYDPNDISELDPGVDPQCSDDQDNDLDGKFDWDGMGAPEDIDPGCTDAYDNTEEDTPPAGYIIPAPIITGPSTGTPGISYNFSAQSAVPAGATGRNYRYGFDWNSDNNVDFWTARMADGTAGSATFTWATVGSKVFKVIAEDIDLKRSTPSYYSINISNDGSGICVPSEFWELCSKPCGGGTQNKLNSCTFEILEQRSCNTKICGTIIREVPP